MQRAAEIVAEAGRPDAGAPARCPHLIFRDLLGSATIAELLEHVAQHERDFLPAIIRNRQTGVPRVDLRQRDCLYLRNLGPFERMIVPLVDEAAPKILAGLNLGEAAVEPREFEICAYGDGGHFGAHVDTNELTDRVRVVSCVYYFARTPRAFSGGELRLHGFPIASASKEPAFVDVVPETDTLVAFPSWLRHEVLPVRVPSGTWLDRRFSINCWLHRAKPRPDGAPGA